jgi:hypothetical protein
MWFKEQVFHFQQIRFMRVALVAFAIGGIALALTAWSIGTGMAANLAAYQQYQREAARLPAFGTFLFILTHISN